MKQFLLSLLFIFRLSSLHAVVYHVQKGDSLWKISDKFNVSISVIRKVNDLYKDTLNVGQKLFIPTEIKNHTVKNGETYDSIANKYSTQLKYIIMLNNISDSQPFENQVLKIPTSKNISEEQKIVLSTQKTIEYQSITYKVKRGDTLSDVALKYKTTVPKLRQLNKKNSNSIYVGEQLIVGNRIVPTKTSNNQIICQSSQETASKLSHIVLKNQTLGQIAINYGVSVQDIKKWNNKKSTSVYIGERLTVYPKKNLFVKNSAKKQKELADDSINYRSINYSVRKGDHLLLIAAKFGVRSSDIKAWNNKSSDRLYVGEQLKIRIRRKYEQEDSGAKTDNTQLIRYKIKNGDTLDGIAIKYKVSRSQLLSWNNKRNSKIYIGEQLKIYAPQNAVLNQPKKSKKAQYLVNNKASGVKSNRFKDVSLPIKASQILQTTTSGRGIDIKLKSEASVVAPANAVISYAGYINALKNVIILDLSDNRTVVYAGLENLNVQKGQTVQKGDYLGVVGKYIHEENPTLYMELRDNKKVANVFHSYQVLAAKQNKKK